MKTLLIVGAGGLGRETYQWAVDQEKAEKRWDDISFLDDDLHALDNYKLSAKIVGTVKDYEPKTALSGGDDGLIFYRRIIDESIDVLNEGGILAFEIGYDQGQSVKSLMKQKDFTELKVVKDLAGLDRVVIGKVIKNKDEKYIKDSHSDIKFIRDTY